MRVREIGDLVSEPALYGLEELLRIEDERLKGATQLFRGLLRLHEMRHQFSAIEDMLRR